MSSLILRMADFDRSVWLNCLQSPPSQTERRSGSSIPAVVDARQTTSVFASARSAACHWKYQTGTGIFLTRADARKQINSGWLTPQLAAILMSFDMDRSKHDYYADAGVLVTR